MLFESAAIVHHIAQRSNALMPADANGRARLLTWMFTAMNTIEPHVQNTDSPENLESLTEHRLSDPPRPHCRMASCALSPTPDLVLGAVCLCQARETDTEPASRAARGHGCAPPVLSCSLDGGRVVGGQSAWWPPS